MSTPAGGDATPCCVTCFPDLSDTESVAVVLALAQLGEFDVRPESMPPRSGHTPRFLEAWTAGVAP